MKTHSLPPDLLAFGTPSSIHPPNHAHDPSQGRQVRRVLLAGFLLLALGTLLAVSMLGPLRGLATGGGIALLIAGWFVIFECFDIRDALDPKPAPESTLGFAIFDGGFGTWRGQEGKFYRWQDIEQFWTPGAWFFVDMLTLVRPENFRLGTRTGECIAVPTNVENYRDLTVALEQGCTEAMCIGNRERLRKGAGASFGRYHVSINRISAVDKTVAWRDVERITEVGGKNPAYLIHCYGSSKPSDMRINKYQLPNHRAFEALVDSIAAGCREAV